MFNEENKNQVKKTNQNLSDEFRKHDSRASFSVYSNAETANQKIQQQFYEQKKENNLLSVHVDVNNPPIKK